MVRACLIEVGTAMPQTERITYSVVMSQTLCQTESSSLNTPVTGVVPSEIAELADRLVDSIRPLGSVAVAFSGGVDSAVVAKAAALALGSNAVAVTGIGPALSGRDRADAVASAAQIGIRHVEVTPDELSNEGYVANEGNRCYFCKTELYEVTKRWAVEHGIKVIANGTNADDLGDYRPGLTAADERGVQSPLADLEIGKAKVRRLAAFWDLNVADKPASPCLASRIAPGVEVTAERLQRIEAAEALVREWTGLQELRVRIEAHDLARIELPQDKIPSAFELLLKNNASETLKTLGFRAVTVDLAGFTSGSLNALVPLAVAEFAGHRSL